MRPDLSLLHDNILILMTLAGHQVVADIVMFLSVASHFSSPDSVDPHQLPLLSEKVSSKISLPLGLKFAPDICEVSTSKSK